MWLRQGCKRRGRARRLRAQLWPAAPVYSSYRGPPKWSSAKGGLWGEGGKQKTLSRGGAESDSPGNVSLYTFTRALNNFYYVWGESVEMWVLGRLGDRLTATFWHGEKGVCGKSCLTNAKLCLDAFGSSHETMSLSLNHTDEPQSLQRGLKLLLN